VEDVQEADKIHTRYCTVILGAPKFAANNFAELELRRDNRRGEVLSRTAKYWLRMYSLEIVRMCYERQINNLNVEG
jgi:hypothetical protein